MKNIEYRVWSATMRLVLFVFIIATALLLLGVIDKDLWFKSAMGLVTAWIFRDSFTKGAEAYRDARLTKAPNSVAPS